MRGDAREKTQNMGKRASIAGKGAIEDERELARAFRRLRRVGFSPGDPGEHEEEDEQE